MRLLLVLRPEPGASATLASARALGLEAVAAPLFAIRPIEPDYAAIPAEFTALLFTSANAVRAISSDLPNPLKLRANGGEIDQSPVLNFPVYAVGEATAAAARAAGFAHVVAGSEDAAGIVARAAGEGVIHLLHLAGREHRAVAHPGVTIERVIVYASDAATRLPDPASDALAQGAVALLHSPRAAALFAHLLDEAGLARIEVVIAALSPAVATAAGGGWRATAVAAEPRDAALLAAAVKLCE